MKQIYLDHNATTPVHPVVAAAIARCYEATLANAASPHEAGRQARRVLEQARGQIARLLGANLVGSTADRLIFTSGATEANNLAIFGLAGEQPGRVIISAIEHPSIVGPAEELARRGWGLERISVSRHGVVDVDHLRRLLNEQTRLVSVMLGNNETGVLQPVCELAALCAAAKVPLHTDAVQVVGKLAVDFRRLGVAAMSASGHKFHGPAGIGVLVLRRDVTPRPIVYGGTQQSGLRAGTEPVALAVGMQEALLLWLRESTERTARMTSLRDRLEARLATGESGVVVNGAGAPRLPHTSNVSFTGVDRQALLMALDLAGVACSTGSACVSGSSERSPVLLAMGCPPDVVDASVRLSLGAGTTAQEVDLAARRILKVVSDLRDSKRAEKSAGTSRDRSPKSL